jgi:hypothetical protein
MLSPRFSQEAMDATKEIGDWFIDEEYTYNSLFGCEGPPHLFPRYVLDRIELREIAYHIFSVNTALTLARN